MVESLDSSLSPPRICLPEAPYLIRKQVYSMQSLDCGPKRSDALAYTSDARKVTYLH